MRWRKPVSYTHLDVYKRQVLRLDRDYDPARSSQSVDREHPQRRLAVDQDMGCLLYTSI